ncbi:MAG: phytanoyl-CoA dioxygenase family protein [Bdellovibrionota bacterium]
MELTERQKSEFRDLGILTLEGFIPKREVAKVKASLKAGLDKISTAKIRDLPIFQQSATLSQMVDGGPGLDELISRELVELMQALAKAKLKPYHPRPQLLLSLPHREEWSLARLNWHLDAKVPRNDEVPGIQAFVLIDDVRPRGGATLAIAGSHRLPYMKGNESRSAHSPLRRHPIFSTLYDQSKSEPEPLFKSNLVDGVEVRVVEMTGQAGDVFLMDMRVLHTPSMNSTKFIRMMATSRFLK